MNTWFSNNVENDEIGTHDKQLITYTIDNDDNVSDTVQDLSYVEGEGDSTATTIGCNHGKVDQKKTPAPYNHSFFWVKCLKVVAKCCLNWIFLSWWFWCCNVEYWNEIFKTYH